MKKMVVSGAIPALVFLFFGFSKFFAPSEISETLESASKTDVDLVKPAADLNTQFDTHLKTLYQKMKLKEAQLDFKPFKTAYLGYLNLKAAGKLNKQILTIIDFTKSSRFKRMWILDMESKRLVRRELVAHGKNSGHDMVTSYSNEIHSNQSSMGFYVTDASYVGSNGISLLIDGMDKGYNCNARQRAVVVHGANYVNPTTMNQMGRLGRSFGCPAVEMHKAPEIINYIKGGSCLFIYSGKKQYLTTSKWLNKDMAIAYYAQTKDVENTPNLVTSGKVELEKQKS